MCDRVRLPSGICQTLASRDHGSITLRKVI
jgi:hypothetical protein